MFSPQTFSWQGVIIENQKALRPLLVQSEWNRMDQNRILSLYMVQCIEKSPLSYIPVSTFIPNIEDFAKEAKRVFISKLGANSLSYLDVPL